MASVRAFLSHATSDKHIVGKVAEILGRASVFFDAYEFKTGDDLAGVIQGTLERSDLFILFASKESIEREWVKFEINLAENRRALMGANGIMTFIIDPDLSVSALPEWMRSTLITTQSAPILIAGDIRRVIGQRLADARPRHFLGRGTETEQAVDILTSYSDPNNRPPLVIYGLTGIGRRSLVDAVARDNLSFHQSLVIHINEGDLLPEILLKSSIVTNKVGLREAASYLKEISIKDANALSDEIIENFSSICRARALPIILDDNALGNAEGNLLTDFEVLYGRIARDPSADVIIVSNRRLHSATGSALPSVRVSELSSSNTLRLVKLLARDKNIAISPDECSVIAEYSRGYPPAIMFAMQEMVTYGATHVAANRHALSKFSEEIFLKQLKADNKISAEQVSIMRLLSSYNSLPMPVIAKYINESDAERMTGYITYLLDFALVVPDGTNYRLSEPVRQAAYRAYGGMGVNHSKVAIVLEEYLCEHEDDTNRLVLSQNLFRATLLSGQKESDLAIGLASDFIKLATQAYHDKDYDDALKYGDVAVSMRPDNINVRRYVAQALIRKERYDEAEVHIAHLLEKGHIKEAYYIKGFMARRRREYEEAIKSYSLSLEHGRRGVAVHRELAGCYFELNKLTDAKLHIDAAEAIRPHNPYVVDLRCMIAIRTGDMDAAERALDVLQRVEQSDFYDHRRSTYEQAIGNSPDALRYARRAVEARAKPQFEILANLANCQIEMSEFPAALLTLNDLDARFAGTHHDTRTGLRCKLELRRGNIDLAEILWKKLRNPGTQVHAGLRLSILSRKLADRRITPEEETERLELVRQKDVNLMEKVMALLGSEVAPEDAD